MTRDDRLQLDRNSKLSLQEQIADILKTEIVDGGYTKGHKLPSVRELATRYNVSRETTYSAITILKEQGLIEIVPNRGAFVVSGDDQPRHRASTGFLGFIVDGSNDPVPSKTIDPLYESMLKYADHNIQSGKNYLATAYIGFETGAGQERFFHLARKIDGLLVANLNNEKLYHTLKHLDIPLVSILSALDVSEIDDVGIDSRRTYFRTCEQLLAAGYKRIAYLDGARVYYQRLRRFQGCSDAVEADPSPHSSAEELQCKGWLSEDSYATIKEWLAHGGKADVLLAANDIMAVGALRACRDAGSAVPGDMGIVGARDTILSRTSTPQLTTIDYYYEELVRTALDRLRKRMDGEKLMPATIKLVGKLIARESCPLSTEKNRGHQSDM